METTLKEIVHYHPCDEGISKLMNNLGIKCNEYNWNEIYHNLEDCDKNKKIDLKFILESNGIEDTYWVLKTQDKKNVMPILADVAESVLHIYEEKYPNDFSVRNCIQGIRDFCNDKITEEDLEKLRDAAFSASWAAYSAKASSASWAAKASSVSAFWAAVADWAASSWAASLAAAYASLAVADASDVQWRKNEEILRKYL
jgi:hypothetical protein